MSGRQVLDEVSKPLEPLVGPVSAPSPPALSALFSDVLNLKRFPFPQPRLPSPALPAVFLYSWARVVPPEHEMFWSLRLCDELCDCDHWAVLSWPLLEGSLGCACVCTDALYIIELVHTFGKSGVGGRWRVCVLLLDKDKVFFSAL